MTLIYAISAGRPSNVPPLCKHFNPDLITWVVPEGEEQDYLAYGADRVLAVSEPSSAPNGARRYGLTAARNKALQDAQGRPSFQTSDDLRGFKRWDNAPASWPTVRDALIHAAQSTGAHLAGLPPTANTFFTKPGIKDHVFIVGDMMYITDAYLLFDETLPLKEDYDYCCKHLTVYGKVARLGDYVANYAHYSNRGGAVRYRTDELENEVTARLLETWPNLLKPHSRREHELMVRSRSAATSGTAPANSYL